MVLDGFDAEVELGRDFLGGFPCAISRGLGLVLNFTPRHSAKSTCRCS